MAKIEMAFRVVKVINADNPSEQWVEAVQAEAPWVNPDFKECKLLLPVINDDRLKQFGPGLQLNVVIDY